MKPKNLLNLKGVIGISEDTDSWNDKNTITVFVKKKLKLDTLKRYIKDKKTDWTEKDIVPKLVGNKLTDVIELGTVRAQLDRKKYRPILGGCEIGIVGQRFVGTAGAIVTAYSFGNLWLLDKWYSFLQILRLHNLIPKTNHLILTNAHVGEVDIAKHKERNIAQPGGSYNVIGRNIYSIPIKQNSTNEYDVSLIKLNTTDFKQENISVGKITGVKDAIIGTEVHKYGRTTDYTEGTLRAKNARIAVDYGGGVIATFKGLDLFTRMSAKGDSGSVIVAKDDNKAVSHLFAGSSTATIGIPMTKIVKRLGIEF